MRSTTIISLRNLLIASIIVLFPFPAICAESVSRGEMVKYILDTLNIPPWTGERTFSDVPESHLHSSYIETARALGLIYPSERFHPDLKATRAEALMFALKAMGWEHESALASWVYQESENDLPAYIAPYHSLAKRIEPSAPSDFLSGPVEDLEHNDLSELQDWIRSCLASMTWHEEIERGVLKLIIHRQGVWDTTWCLGCSDLFFSRKDGSRGGYFQTVFPWYESLYCRQYLFFHGQYRSIYPLWGGLESTLFTFQ